MAYCNPSQNPVRYTNREKREKCILYGTLVTGHLVLELVKAVHPSSISEATAHVSMETSTNVKCGTLRDVPLIRFEMKTHQKYTLRVNKSHNDKE